MIYRREDRKICEGLLRAARKRGDGVKPLAELVVAVGQQLLGAPYEADTLEGKGPEELVVNLRAFDCVTFLENTVVLAGLIRSGATDFTDYAAALERIRYRRGRCDGYASRLHYFTDWLSDNERKGLLRNITREIGGIACRKALHSLTDRREDRPGLQDPAEFRRMRIIEGICSRRPLFYIPKADLNRIEERIGEGDIIAITTDERGLDVSHTGIAAPVGGHTHLLHASSAAGRVVLSEVSLKRYLLARRTRTGIIVARPTAPGHAGGIRMKRPAALPRRRPKTGT